MLDKPQFGERVPFRGSINGRNGYWVPVGERGWRQVTAGEFLDRKYDPAEFEDRSE